MRLVIYIRQRYHDDKNIIYYKSVPYDFMYLFYKYGLTNLIKWMYNENRKGNLKIRLEKWNGKIYHSSGVVNNLDWSYNLWSKTKE